MYKVRLEDSMGMVKEVPLGFSWTTFLFGFFVPLFRKDWKWATIFFVSALVLNWIANKLGINFGAIIVGILGGIFYNGIYAKELMEKGWKPASELDAQILHQKGIF